jgi:hypothetical protein
VVVEIKDAGLLPALASCPDGSLCEGAVTALWERTILNTRHVTCVKRWLDVVVADVAPRVAYDAAVGSLDGPRLPPFGQAPLTAKAFGVGLTWDEAVKVAAHPFVERVWSSSGLQYEPSMGPGCPPDLTKAIPTEDCPMTRDSGDGKIGAEDAAQFAQGVEPFDVLVTVLGGPVICPLPVCATSTCPERAAIIARWQAESLASQQCVRALVSELGGSSAADTIWLVNAFEATLTSAQIEAVSQHPQVVRIELNQKPVPPP